jgi:hypothetical protein
MYKISEYKDTNKENFYNFLKNENYISRDKSMVNMWNDNWEDHPYTLPYLLEKSTRFNSPKGKFYILEYNNEIIGCSGCYISDFSNLISICGARLYMKKEFRNKLLVREFLFPVQKQWSIDQGCKILVLTFNEYNKNLIYSFFRFRLAETRNKLSIQTPDKLFYKNVYKLDFPVTIQNTKQYVVYEKLSEDFNFDWESIRFVETKDEY